jgi:hypothetical protein
MPTLFSGSTLGLNQYSLKERIMKQLTQLIFVVALSGLGASAFAEGAKTEAPAMPAAPTAQATKPATKVSYKMAKQECLKTTPHIKGKELQACIKGKQAL